jgi:hypothetical protein
MNERLRSPKRYMIFIGILIVAIWLPRGLALDRFVTPDERKWLARSANFYYALTHGDFSHTYQREHPGVTIMWAGTAGFLSRYLAYARETPGQFDHDAMALASFLQAHGHEPLELLTAGRVFVVLGITVALMLAFLAAVRLFGFLSAAVGFLLIAFDPFHVAHSRLLHLDGLESSLMLLSLLALLNYLYRGRRRVDLVISAIAAGLGWLTKSPAFILAPFAGLVMLIELLRDLWVQHRFHIQRLKRFVWPLIAWAGVGLATYVLLWPAMWVDPVGSLERVFNAASFYAAEGHVEPIYFNGAIIEIEGDPGLHFYLVTYLWRTTPVVLVGLGLAAVAFASRRTLLAQQPIRSTVVVLVLFTVLFTVFISLGAKKFDRYLLPIYAPLDLVAAVGWVATVHWLKRQRFAVLARFAAPVVLSIAIMVQILGTLWTFPYYLSYYNPLFGDGAKATEVMMIGWGEGLDQAARYLNAKPNAEQMRVMSWYPDGPFSYFFKGQTLRLGATWDVTTARQLLLNTDYLVLYIHQWQRQLPNRDLLAYFAEQTPEHVVRINGLEYAYIYDMRDMPSLDDPAGRSYLAELEWAQLSFEASAMQHGVGVRFGGFAELLGYDLNATEVTTGEKVKLTLYWRAINEEALTTSYTVFTHLLDEEGRLIGGHDGIPAGEKQPTMSWVPGEVITDVHEIDFSDLEYTGRVFLEIGLYESFSIERVSTEDGRDHIILPTVIVVKSVADK